MTEKGECLSIRALVVFCIVGMYLLLNFGVMLCGFLDQVESRKFHNSCLKKPIRIASVFPGYKLGCWLGSAEGEQWHYEEPAQPDEIENCETGCWDLLKELNIDCSAHKCECICGGKAS